MGIRITVTLDDDVLERVRRESRARGCSFRAMLNDLLRRALPDQANLGTKRPFQAQPRNMHLRVGLPYDSTADLLEFAEGPLHR
jgi:hypothetical protein